MLAPLACLAVGGFFSAKGLGELFEHANENTAIYNAKGEIDNIPKNKEVPAHLQEFAKKKPHEMAWSTLLLPSSMLIAAAALFGMTAIFSMRTNGLYGRYFMDRLDLETMAVEVTYVSKARNLRELEAKAEELSWKPVLMGLGLAYSAGTLLGGSIGMTFLTSFLEGLTYGMMLVGAGAALVGVVWFVMVAVKKKKSEVKFATAVLISGLVCGGIGAAIYSFVDMRPASSLPPEAAGPAAAKAQRGK
jgi:hypothetical protein